MYQAWYFYAAVSLLAVWAAWATVRRRIQRVKGSMGIVLEERNRISRECHDTLMAGFARMLDVNHINQRAIATLEIDGEEIPLAPGSVHHLTCIGQEAVTNALRHAQPTHVTIQLRYDDEALHLAIRDDGRGFQRGETTGSGRGHFGIPVMEERARKLGGTLSLDSTPGGGTEVPVSVPFGALEQPMRREQDVVRWIGI